MHSNKIQTSKQSYTNCAYELTCVYREWRDGVAVCKTIMYVYNRNK